MKKDQELTVITKTYDLILWSCHHTSRFPRNHRFVLGERIERNLYNLLETLVAAKYTRNRQRLLEDANLALEILRFRMRLANPSERAGAKSRSSSRVGQPPCCPAERSEKAGGSGRSPDSNAPPGFVCEWPYHSRGLAVPHPAL